MTEDFIMRMRLEEVLAYRRLQQTVRSGANRTIINAGILLFLDYLIFQLKGRIDLVIIIYLMLALAELAVGLWKKFFPTLEAVLVDGFVLGAFGVFILGRQFLAWQGLILFPVSPISVAFGIIWLLGAKNMFKNYRGLCRAFPERPTAEVQAWFDDLIYEIRHADPAADDLALDLPTRPHWRAKLLGTTAFFVSKAEVLVAGPLDFGLTPDPRNAETGRLRVHLHIHDRVYKPFELDEASWANYRKWVAQQAALS